MPISTTSPENYIIESIKDGKVEIKLRKNIIEKNDSDPITNRVLSHYEFDEVIVKILNRADLESYIQNNFESLFVLGETQLARQYDKEKKEKEINELIQNFGILEVNKKVYNTIQSLEDETYANLNQTKEDINNTILQVDDNIKLLEIQTRVDLNQAKEEAIMSQRIDSGEITSENFNSLSITEQNLVKMVLFKRYSPNQTQVPRTFSAIEFALIGIFKLMGKALDRTKLTIEENAYLDEFVNTINLNDMPINDSTDWRYQYFKNEFINVQNNRQEYFQTKQNITGTTL